MGKAELILVEFVFLVILCDYHSQRTIMGDDDQKLYSVIGSNFEAGL